MLTETAIQRLDRRELFVGLDAYEAGGGTMLHDLFQGDDGGWLEDPPLMTDIEGAAHAKLLAVYQAPEKQ